jgi:DUF1680 family protein
VWARGDRLRLELDQVPRLTFPDRRVDALRGCVAIEHGPVVYCVEQADLADGTDLSDVTIRADSRPTLRDPAGDGEAPTISVAGIVRSDASPPWPYGRDKDVGEGRPVELIAVPYHRWANRGSGAMRVWLPATTRAGS